MRPRAGRATWDVEQPGTEVGVVRLASVQGCLVESGWDGCCRPIKQTTTKLRCCIARMRLEADLGEEEETICAVPNWVG